MRMAHCLRVLRLSSPLQSVAVGQARDMVIGDYFGDRSLSGRTPLQRILATRYPGRAWRLATAQNIGWATGPLATPAGMVEAWMHSPPHREIILTSSFRDVGVGVTPAAPSSLSQGLGGATYTIEFGQRIFLARAAAKR
ncbi:MAG: CAP domain-containing protein [Solirubrobacterales bacterium]